MTEIDFVPDWYRAKCQRKRNLTIRAMGLGILAIAMVLISVAQYTRIASARKNLARLQYSFESQAEVIQGLNELEYRLSQLREKQSLLSDVAGGAHLYGVLAEFSHLMPDAMMLTEFHIVQEQRIVASSTPEEMENEDPGTAKPPADKKKGKFEVTGLASSDVKVGSLMGNMARSELFDGVRLRYSKSVVVDGLEAREFKLISRLRQFK